MKARSLSFIFICLAAHSGAGDFVLQTGGGPPGSVQFEVIVKEAQITVTRSGSPMTQSGPTKTLTSKNLTPNVTEQLLKLAAASTDFQEGCNGVPDGTNATLIISGKKTAECVGAASWPKGPKTTEFLKAINANLPKDFQVY